MWMDEDGGGGGGAWRLIYQTDRPTTLVRPASRRGAHRLSNEQRTEGRTGGLAAVVASTGLSILDSRLSTLNTRFVACCSRLSTPTPIRLDSNTGRKCGCERTATASHTP